MPLCFTPEEAGQFWVVCPTEESGPEPIVTASVANVTAPPESTTVSTVPTDAPVRSDAEPDDGRNQPVRAYRHRPADHTGR